MLLPGLGSAQLAAVRVVALDERQKRSRRPSALPFTDGQAQAAALTPKRSGAAEGVGDGRCPAPVQIDHGGRRGPFSGL